MIQKGCCKTVMSLLPPLPVLGQRFPPMRMLSATYRSDCLMATVAICRCHYSALSTSKSQPLSRLSATLFTTTWRWRTLPVACNILTSDALAQHQRAQNAKVRSIRHPRAPGTMLRREVGWSLRLGYEYR